jgi:hypothetical protein
MEPASKREISSNWIFLPEEIEKQARKQSSRNQPMSLDKDGVTRSKINICH